jgi:NAD(P)H dehydrogenase (quinone)
MPVDGQGAMSMIAVTGATGHLGRLVLENLLERGMEPARIAALVRSPEKAEGLAALSVQVRRADYSQPETLGPALQGVEKLLLVSSSEMGRRAEQHRNVVEAARAAGVKLLAYTSILKADTSAMQLAAEHRATEEAIRASGLPFVFLRNGWYLENYTGNLASALEHGALLGSAGEGRVSAATRADFAAAAAAVLTGPGHENRAYELGGDEAFTLAELAGIVAEVSGRPVEYRDLPEEAYAGVLAGFGLPEAFARVLADSDRGIARGELFTDSGDLARLIGRPTTPPWEAVAAALRA